MDVIFTLKLFVDEKHKIHWTLKEIFYSGYCKEDVIMKNVTKKRKGACNFMA